MTEPTAQQVSFAASNGQRFTIEINTAAVKKIRQRHQLDLLDVVTNEQKTLERLTGDPVLLIEIVADLCEAQANDRGLSPEDFAALLTGDGIAQAADALFMAISFFFPTPQRQTIQNAWQLTKQLSDHAARIQNELLTEPATLEKLKTELPISKKAKAKA
jgi:hypothetical protein